MFRRLLFVLSLSFCFLPFAFAQDSPRRDPQAVELLTQANLLLGGFQKAVINDVRVDGTVSRPDAPNSLIGTFVARARGRDLAVDTTLGSQTIRYRVLGGRGSIKTSDGIKPLRPYQTLGLSMDILPLFARWNEFSSGSAEVGAVGTDTIGGARCHRILVKGEATSENSVWGNEHDKQEVFVDEASGLVLAIRYTATQGPYVQDKVLVENRYSEYKYFGAFFLPSRITRHINGVPGVVLFVESVGFNTGLTDRDFQNQGERQ